MEDDLRIKQQAVRAANSTIGAPIRPAQKCRRQRMRWIAARRSAAEREVSMNEVLTAACGQVDQPAARRAAGMSTGSDAGEIVLINGRSLSLCGKGVRDG